MADIFVSYARGDKHLVAPLVEALEAQGWSVWWDPSINTGQEFDRLISSELDAARVVIVVWTPTSVESRWVRGEAREGATRGVLVPVRFANARLPIDVRSLHTTDLDDWQGRTDSATFQELARALRAALSESPEAQSARPAAIPDTAVAASPAARRHAPTRRPMLAVGGIAVLLLIGAGVIYAFKAELFHQSASYGSAPSRTDVRIAVLPFDVLSEAPAVHHFADGLTDEIVSTLSTNQMQTVSRDDSVTLRGAGRDGMLAKLDANLLFDGTVEERGDALHVRVHIDSTEDHRVLWSGDFTGAAKEAQTLQTAVATEVAGLIQMAIYAKSPGSASIDNVTLAMTLKVVDALRYSHDQEQQIGIQAIQLAEQVVARAPDFAWGHSILSNALGWEEGFAPTNSADHQKLTERRRAEAERALALDPRDAMTYFALSALATSPREFETIILKGLSVDPHPAIFVGGLYGREAGLLASQGRMRESLPFWRKAAALDPLSAWESGDLALTLAALGQMDEAKAVMNRCLTLWPNDPEIRTDHLMTLTFYGAPNEAPSTLNDPAVRPPGLNEAAINALRAFIDTRTTPNGASKAGAMRSIRAAATSGALDPGIAAPMLSQLGDTDAAFAVTADSAHPIRQIGALFIPAAAKMRADPRFMHLAAKLGNVDYWQSADKWPDFCTEETLAYNCKTEAARAVVAR